MSVGGEVIVGGSKVGGGLSVLEGVRVANGVLGGIVSVGFAVAVRVGTPAVAPSDTPAVADPTARIVGVAVEFATRFLFVVVTFIVVDEAGAVSVAVHLANQIPTRKVAVANSAIVNRFKEQIPYRESRN